MKPKKLKLQLIYNARLFFISHVDDKEIQKIKLIHTGLTNNSFLIKTNKDQYVVRLSQQYEQIDRFLEKEILMKMIDVIYIDEDGNYIKKYIEGCVLKKRNINKSFLDSLIKQINIFHSIEVKTNKKNNFFEYTKNQLDKKYVLYKNLLCEYKDKKLILSHNDINNNNILVDKNKVILIDYEWANLNYDWFDIHYFIIHSGYSPHTIIKKFANYFDIKKLFIVSYFCLSWIKTINNKSLKFMILKSKYKKHSNYFYKKISPISCDD